MEAEENPLNCCRCCLKPLISEKSVKISKAIKIRFLQLTEITLIDSELYSNFICVSCNSKLSEFSDFRDELREYQSRLLNYEFINDYEGYGFKKEEESIIEEQYIDDTLQVADEGEEEMLIETYVEEECREEEEEVEIILDDETIEDTEFLKPTMKTCTICNIELCGSSLYHHMMRFHQTEFHYECDVCGKTYNLKNDLSMHIKIHLNKQDRKKYLCSQCDSTFLSKSALQNHEKSFHSDNVEIHPCEYCDKSFSSRMKYLQHRTVHLTKNEFVCQTCERNFSSKNALSKHIENVHGAKISCSVCNKLIRPLSMKRHLMSHQRKQFICPYEGCEKEYQIKTSLKNHISAHHEISELAYCDFCGCSFITQRHLQRHVSRQHNSEKYQCEVAGCKNMFSRKDYLAQHYQKHKDIDEKTREMLIAKVKEIKIISW